ncbi:MAG: transposase [Williamsia sp.]|nr:transposase [Williamsia sp.]
MNIFLRALGRVYGKYRIILCLDSAGWHTSGTLEVPQDIRLLLLPPYSPQLNPTEHLWDYIREQKGFNNHVFTSIYQVEGQLSKALREINRENDVIKSMCNFSWLNVTPC